MTSSRIVTGAGTGIGKAVALALMKDGFNVVLCISAARSSVSSTCHSIPTFCPSP
jgi:NAD(P)-dependent dehydrogenase (short-subunit alcohol dehydrogenase family)